MAALKHLASLLAFVTLSASVPISRDENSFGFGVQNTTYDSEQTVCVVDDVLYRSGDSLASANACERCVCVPPDFVCEPVACPMSPGCRAVQSAGQCCPTYHCECEVDGKIYQNGEKVEATDRPCHVCYCRGGYVVCAALECYRRHDCAPRQEPGACCPKYDHCPPLENAHRRYQQFPVLTTSDETDNHIHRTLLLEDDQQLDATNTDERILRLGEGSGVTRQPNFNEHDATQSDEAVDTTKRRASVLSARLNNSNPTEGYEAVEGPTTVNSFENLQTPGYSAENKNILSLEIKESNKEANETTESIPVNTDMKLEIQTNELSGTDNSVLGSLTTSDPEYNLSTNHITQSFTTEAAEINWNDSSDTNFLDITKTEIQQPITTESIFTEETLIERTTEDNKTDMSTEKILKYVENSKEEGTVSEYFVEYSTVPTTLGPERQTNSVISNEESKSNGMNTDSENNMQNDILIEYSQKIAQDSAGSAMRNREMNKTKTPEFHSYEPELITTAVTEIPYDNTVISDTNRADTENAKETMLFSENEQAESQRTSPIITNIRVTDDDEYDGGVITDDAEESTDDNRPPITTDKIFYSYDKNDSSKPTTIEAFAVSGNTLETGDRFSTPVYNGRHGFPTTTILTEIVTEEAVTGENNDTLNEQFTTMTTEFGVTTWTNDLTTTDILMDINTETIPNQTTGNKTDNKDSVFKTTNISVDNIVIYKDNSSEIVKKDSENKPTLKVPVDKESSKILRNESLANEGTSSSTGIDIQSKVKTPINNPTKMHKSEVDTADVFVREEPPVLLFKDELAIHQMDVVVTDNEEEELEHSNEHQDSKSNYVIVPTTTDATTNTLSTDPVDIEIGYKQTETKKLLEKGYITGSLNDDGSLPEIQKVANVEVESTVSPVGTHDNFDKEEQVEITTQYSLLTTVENRINIHKSDVSWEPTEANTSNETNLTGIPDLSKESEKKYIAESETEPSLFYASTTTTNEYNEPMTNENFPLEKVQSDPDTVEFNEASKILPEIVPLRQNITLHKHETQDNSNVTRQESTTVEMPILPENWLKYINESSKDDDLLIPSTTAEVESTQSVEDLTPLYESTELATEDSTQKTYFDKFSHSYLELKYNNTNVTDSHGNVNEGPVQTVKERNFRSDDSENLDKQDLLVLQEFFRKLYHH